ncbi:MAG: DUF6178 family protein [Polyangiaceae bacterium]
MTLGITRLPSTRLLERLIATPDLVRGLQALAPRDFSALIRRIGVEDAGELIAAATVEQLTQAFDEDLFISDAPGERERFDTARFATWLEVLLEAGDTAAAERLSALSEDFLLHALLQVMVVLDDDALRERMDVGDETAEQADKALASALSEQLDGYLLLGRGEPGWDAWISVILALDREDRGFLERILDRAVAACGEYLDDLDELCEALSQAESLAEDVEAEREERRSAQGYVEPRAAAAFLKLAAQPHAGPLEDLERDANTRAYFRDLARVPSGSLQRPAIDHRVGATAELPRGNEPEGAPLEALLEGFRASESAGAPELPKDGLAELLQGALDELHHAEPARAAAFMEELAYLANVLLAGARSDGGAMAPTEAANAALSSVVLGALLESGRAGCELPTKGKLGATLGKFHADILFRRASAELARLGPGRGGQPFLAGMDQVPDALRQLRS